MTFTIGLGFIGHVMPMYLISLFVIVSIVAVIWLTSFLKIKAFIALFLVSVFLAFSVLPAETVVDTLKSGFGNTMASIGFLIILGSIIGITLDKTGGMASIAEFILNLTGEKRSGPALAITGYVCGMPIFCDSGYIILSGLATSFSARSKLAMPFMATVLATSLYSVHCLIPTHPGALAAAGIIGVNLGHLIVLGMLFAVPGVVAAYFWSKQMSRLGNYAPAVAPEKVSDPQSGQLPSPFLALLPVVVPLLLITLKSLVNLFDPGGQGLLSCILYFPGEPIFALSIGVILALLLVKGKKSAKLDLIFSEAIDKAGPILIVTAAGGMFGMVIKSTGIGEAAGQFLAGTHLGIVVPFLIAAMMKTAQGSSTVSIITTASFVVPMMTLLGLDSEWGKVLTLLSMGAGSMMISHANDSYFWVVTNFSGIDSSAALRVYSTSTLIMSLSIFAGVWITSLFVLG